MELGVLSHEMIDEMKIPFTPIYNADIVNLRKNKFTPDGHSLWHFANFYLQPRNPMLYLVTRNFGTEDIAVVSGFRGPAYETDGAYITDGNAASSETIFLPISKKDEVFRKIKVVDGLEYWKEEDGTKRMMMAEVLIPEKYSREHLRTIYVATQATKDKIERLLSNSSKTLPVIVDPRTFFSPEYEVKLTDNLSLVRGDMFFSGMQTLTISVNTKGIMGRGLASRTKYQFPDVYIKYQDYCKKRELRLGKPVLYKRETALDIQLADNPNQLSDPNNKTWFLLFATKGDWRKPAQKDAIIEGLKWLVENYQQEGIKSLAIPALGCGLGWLSWAEIGPILCKYLSQIQIPVQLYLPAETNVPKSQLTKEFLLN